jgi:hypothetical protein
VKKLLALLFIVSLSSLLTGCLSAARTPLGEAAEKGDINAVKDLLAKGSNACEIQNYGATPYMIAAYYDLTIFPLDVKYRTCRDEIYRILMDNASETLNKGGLCPALLYYAAGGGCNDIVKEQLGKGYNPNDKHDVKHGEFTTLGYAAFHGQLETVKILLNKGADLDSAISGLQASASRQLRGGLSEPLTRKTYDKANRGIEMLSGLKPVTVVKLHQEVSPIIKSDVDELPSAKVKANNNSYAIIIGIEQYRQKLPKADFAVSDAKLVSEYLSKVMGYPEENIVTLTNEHASKSDFEKYFEKWLFNNAEKDSTVFVYYSGHGAPNTKTGDAYLVPYDGDPSFIEQTGYSLKKLYESLNKLQAKEIIVALDSCFSGAGGRSVIAKGARPLVMNLQSNMVLSKNMTVLSASSGDQTSSTYDEKGHGLFTYFLLKGIKNEDVVKPDGSIKMDDLFGYIKPQVERIARKQYNNEQTPQLIGHKASLKD